MTSKVSAYGRLEARFARIGALKEALGVLHWDLSTVMPKGGIAARAEQIAALNVTCHELLTAPGTADDLESAKADALDPWQAANLREMRRLYVHEASLPVDLVEARSRAAQTCETAWRQARTASDFPSVLPAMTELLNLTRQVAAAKGEALGCSPYQALMDEHDPGLTADVVDPLFAGLASFLPGFLAEVEEAQNSRPKPLQPQGPFALSKQADFARDLMARLGFDFAHGRLDTSLHPFCGGVPDDVRITTRYDEADFAKALMGVLHETGHAFYERGLPPAWRRQPVGMARGMAMHESQSLLFEMQACRSRAFIGFLAPLLKAAYRGEGEAWEVENLYRLGIRVRRSFIRVDADEVTYPAHIILRYELERAMIGGDLALADLPGAWKAGMERLLGIAPPDDARGCLQDIHWYDGAWGYFPSYTIGAIMAAQFMAAAKKDTPVLDQDLAKGDFSALVAWLGKAVHAVASFDGTEGILRAATGEGLNLAPYKNHLRRRYLA